MPGMMLHQDGSTHEWVPGQHWDLIVTMDDATNEHYSMFFVEEEGTQSSFRGVREVIEARGLFSAFYSDRGSHYWTTPEAGGKVDKVNLTQFGRAMKHLGIHMIAAYSPEARGRSERAFATHQGRLPKELALAGITDMDSGQSLLAGRVPPGVQCGIRATAAGRRHGIRAFPGRKLGRHPVRAIRTHRGQRQLCAFRGPYATNTQRPAPVSLRQSQSAGASLPGRHAGDFSRPPPVGDV